MADDLEANLRAIDHLRRVNTVYAKRWHKKRTRPPLISSRTPPGRPCDGKSSTAPRFVTTLMGSPPRFPARAANGREAASHPEIAGASHWGMQSDATVARVQCAAWRALAFRQRQAQLWVQARAQVRARAQQR